MENQIQTALQHYKKCQAKKTDHCGNIEANESDDEQFVPFKNIGKKEQCTTKLEIK